MRSTIIISAILLIARALPAQDADAGKVIFEGRCARCHGAEGAGGDMAPAIPGRLAALADAQLAALLRDGLPARGMPGNLVDESDMPALTRYLRTIQDRGQAMPLKPRTVSLTDGKKLDGLVLNEGFTDLQLRTPDSHVHLLRVANGAYREVTTQKDWPGYNGDPGGNRYTALSQIASANISQLEPKWMFQIPGAARIQATPSVVSGIMYIANGSECYALDAGTGREIWHYQPAGTALAGGRGGAAAPVVAGGTNRGVATAGDRVFMISERNHLIALNRFTGGLLWNTATSDPKLNYYASSAPLAVGNLLISGQAGGEHGARGFLAAYDQDTGKEVWRLWTAPQAGDPNAETWQGKGIEHPGAPTWFTGTYDASTDTVFWPTGNPSAEYNGDERLGDNLYSDCVLALDPKTGKIKWYYQFTPHDLWDYDSTETLMVVDAEWHGQPRKLLMEGNRNGFFYVFDRTNGTLLLAKPFVRNLTWASSIGPDGRPIKNPNQVPTTQGTRVCPSQDGATNWPSPSYNPATGLFYLQTEEKCSIYTKRDPGEWQSGRQYLGGTQHTDTESNPAPERVLKALDAHTGEIAWEVPQPGPATGWGGTISTSTGIVFYAEESGSFVAADAKTGRTLWSFPTNQSWHASPIAYEFDGQERIAIVTSLGCVLSFGLSGN